MLALLYEVGDDRHLPAELRPEGSGLRYRARPRHVQRSRRASRPVPLRREEVEALLRVCNSWRDRFLIVVLWFGGIRVGEALGLRRSDLHLVPTAAALGCSFPGAHLHVVARDNPNRARAKSGDRAVPVRTEVLSCYDRYLAEREACPAEEGCDFVLVNMRQVDRLDEDRPADPVEFRKTEEAATIDAALPGTNVITRSHGSARDSFRFSDFEFRFPIAGEVPKWS